MTKEKLENNNIHGPQGALLALQNIDFERMRDAHLQATVVLYLSRDPLSNGATGLSSMH